MSNDLNFYINGEWVKSESNETIDVINPANEEVIGEASNAKLDDVNKALKSADDGFKKWKNWNTSITNW